MMDAKYWNDLAVDCLQEAAKADGSDEKTWLEWALNAMKKAMELRSKPQSIFRRRKSAA